MASNLEVLEYRQKKKQYFWQVKKGKVQCFFFFFDCLKKFSNFAQYKKNATKFFFFDNNKKESTFRVSNKWKHFEKIYMFILERKKHEKNGYLKGEKWKIGGLLEKNRVINHI